MHEDVQQQIVSVVAEILELDPKEISLQKELGQIYELDSVAMLEILVTLERRFKVRIQESEIRQIKTLQDVVALIGHKLEQV